ncbi:MAG: arginine--tRNA ligase [Vulcanimicrobiaceae bacterium]
MSPITTDVTLPESALEAFRAALGTAIALRYPQAGAAAIAFEAPRRPEFGDFATNAAFALAKVARIAPNAVAEQLIADVNAHAPGVCAHFTSIEPVAGFINLRLTPAVWQAQLAQIVRDAETFGSAPSNGTHVSLEFGSANPTGPLVVVQGRTLSIGDTLAKAMRMRGYDVFTEWIVNDFGTQIDTLGRSLYARYLQHFDPAHPFPEDGYPGEYLVPIAADIAQRDAERWIVAPQSEWLPYFSRRGLETLLALQKETARRFGVHYDLWQSERALHESGRVREDIDHLRELGLTYESEGALFFRATDYGDDKDRVVLRSDGRPTYYGADIAYHYEKLKRADRVIDLLGPDHHGYIGRLKGLATALGYPGRLDVMIAQQITLMRAGERVGMSKRAGNIITLDDILDEVGVDAARFFFVMLATDSPLTFDLALAVEQTSDNPVYYVQYGHARIASVLRNADAADVALARSGARLERLSHAAELTLARRLSELPGVVQGVVDHLAPHRLAKYARDVATDFHQFYTECKILVEDRELRVARLALALGAKSVLTRVLDLVGVSAPETM